MTIDVSDDELEAGIAAARTMLAALKEISAWVPSATPGEPGGMSIMDAIDIADAAIAQAEAAGIKVN